MKNKHDGPIHLLAIAADYTEMFPAMLAYYRALGVDHIHVHARGRAHDDPELERIVEAVKAAGGRIATMTLGDWAVSLTTSLYDLTRRQFPDDWFLVADPDEFQVYPDGLREAIGRCVEKGYEYIEGCFVDRVGDGGRLCAIDPAREVWENFPMAGFVTGPVCGGAVNKVVATRGPVKMSPGQHRPLGGRGCPVGEQYAQVHHFKWIEGLVEKLEARVKVNREKGGNVRYSHECERFIEHYRKEDRIRIEDKELLFERCGRVYGRWPEVVRLRMAASLFLPS